MSGWHWEAVGEKLDGANVCHFEIRTPILNVPLNIEDHILCVHADPAKELPEPFSSTDDKSDVNCQDCIELIHG